MTTDQAEDAATRTTLVLGGARSGKSAFAENLVLETGLLPVYVATGRVWDEEMRARIEHHKARRGDNWKTIEEPDDLERVLVETARPDRAILIDCMTLWITNLMMAESEVGERIDRLCQALALAPGPVVLVSNEVGLGIVPENAMAREFRDHAGRLHQEVAALAGTVYFIAAGLPLTLKG